MIVGVFADARNYFFFFAGAFFVAFLVAFFID
jgi:hypothetical protein